MRNRVLIVDLTTGNFKKLELDELVMRDYLGGRGLGVYLLNKYLKKGTDPLAPENVVIFSTGPLQGTNAYYGSKCVLTTKSPLTGRYLFSVGSGSFGHQLVKAGYIALVIMGRASYPSYLRIENEQVTINSAQNLWGKKTFESQKQLREEAKLPNGESVCIGPAGEQLVRIASVMTGGEKGRSFGRGGCGAILGSKNLKGIVVQGTGSIKPYNVTLFNSTRQAIRENLKKQQIWVNKFKRGTGSDIELLSELGILPTRNWTSGVFEKVKELSFSNADEVIWSRKDISCGPFCPSSCAHIGSIKSGPYKGAITRGPEYETIYAFGPNCGISRIDAIVAAEEICDEYGIDTMSCGTTIAYAMECFERGLITKEDTNGLELKFGNPEAMVEMTKMIARGEGFGKLLGHGSRKAEEMINSPGISMHCKGLELGGYECRSMWGQALAYALSTRGGCHHAFGLPARNPIELTEGNKISGKGALVRKEAINRIIFDSAIMCAFPQNVLRELIIDIINSVVHFNYTQDDISKIGLRVATLERMFNLREGASYKEDYLPKRLLEEPLKEGPRQGNVIPMKDLLQEGYRSFGWDENKGIPLEETLINLGLENSIQ